MRSKTLLIALMTGVCTLALTACDTVGDAWNKVTGDDTPYAGDIQSPPAQQNAQNAQPMMPQAQMMQPMQQPMAQQQMLMQPMMNNQMAMAQPVIPPTAMQPATYAQQPMSPAYQPNLASVPPRPAAAQLPSPQQVQAARADLMNDNRMVTGYLRDPGAPITANGTPIAPVAMQQQPMQMAQTQMPVQQQPIQSNAASMGIPAGMPLQTASTPNLNSPVGQVVQTGTVQVTQQTQSAPSYTAPATMMTSSDQLLGLQATTPGHYALSPLPPESPLGGFSLASSLIYPQGSDQVSMPQYQELRRVAGQYAQQPGRVRVVSYSDAAAGNQQALQRATNAAAYLVDLGVPANAIRVKVDSAAPGAMPAMGAPISKTDIFLETPVTH